MRRTACRTVAEPRLRATNPGGRECRRLGLGLEYVALQMDGEML